MSTESEYKNLDRFHTDICVTLYNQLEPNLNPPVTSKQQKKCLKKNVIDLVLNSNLHVFDDGDAIWKKLVNNKHKISYFDEIDFEV